MRRIIGSGKREATHLRSPILRRRCGDPFDSFAADWPAYRDLRTLPRATRSTFRGRAPCQGTLRPPLLQQDAARLRFRDIPGLRNEGDLQVVAIRAQDNGPGPRNGSQSHRHGRQRQAVCRRQVLPPAEAEGRQEDQRGVHGEKRHQRGECRQGNVTTPSLSISERLPMRPGIAGANAKFPPVDRSTPSDNPHTRLGLVRRTPDRLTSVERRMDGRAQFAQTISLILRRP